MSQDKNEIQARRLREVLKGRLNQGTAQKLIEDFGGEQEALDFILNEDEDKVLKYLKEDPDYVRALKVDAERVASLLVNGIKATVRQFACQGCSRSWWMKVPERKEVSKCHRCKIRYDPIPKDMEWGVGKFVCDCGNEFTGFAQMGVTSSECYECGLLVPVDQMLPPRKDRPRKTKTPHSCNGIDCISHRHGVSNAAVADLSAGFGAMTVAAYNGPRSNYAMSSSSQNDNRFYSSSQPSGGYPGRAKVPLCTHPMANFKIPIFSRRHKSTGSTVSTFLSQGSLDNMTVSQMGSMASIKELD
ncbi:unnamed protein product [Lymnaea stagnalis]|uniref:Uncharacterized protein n=1 Tax=Lymnaea stagnalis TaxID=6523 RepID=A0AAV2H4X2_LYMST